MGGHRGRIAGRGGVCGRERIRTVHPGEVLLLRSSLGFSPRLLGEGKHWVGPWFHHPVTVPLGSRILTVPAEGETLTLSSRQRESVLLQCQVGVKFSIQDLPPGATVSSPEELKLQIAALLREKAAQYSFLELYRTRVEEFHETLRAPLEEILKKNGYHLESVSLRYGFPPESEAALAVYDRKHAGSNSTRVILMGVDSANWRIINSLVAEGRLPNFARLIRQGARGTLLSEPPYFTPVIWTTIATGKSPDQHGITSFTVEVPEKGESVPITSNYHRVPALWNMAGAYGKKVGVVGWWVTWPSEKVNGFMCSDYTWPILKGKDGKFITFAEGGALPERTYPPELLSRIQKYIYSPDQTEPELLRLLGLSEMPTLENPENPPLLPATFARDRSYASMGLALRKEYHPDFFAVYFEGTDVVSHWFWHLYEYYRWKSHGEPTIFKFDLDPATSQEYQRYGRAVERYYEYQDRILGDYAAAMDSNTVLIVVSDHGYGANERKQQIYVGDNQFKVPIHWHKPEGIILMYGKNVTPGVTIEGAEVMDVAPTILYLMGLPLAQDFRGKPLLGAIDRQYQQRNPVVWVDSYNRIWKPERKPGPLETEATGGLMEMLRSLGYVQ